MSSWEQVKAIVWKDTISEVRTKEIVPSVLVFAVLVIVVFSFAFGTDQELVARVAPGILWATFAFAGVLSLSHSFVAEREQGCIEGMMACPVSREVIYIGKMLSNLLFMIIIEAIALPVFTLLFNLPVLSPPLVLITFLATLGFAAVGTLFSALAINTRAREMVLPILFLPIIVPVIIGAVRASGMALAGEPWSAYASWVQIITAFDVVTLLVCYLIFNFVIEE